ncbi:sugar O-acetyltransferase [Enterococcus sp. HY326]|uniref:sugar O-acetyltransferase n=1 Tax=Enterococcus sp. HY326 TaxID=2971265 RepID=UPI00223F649C|nr:sugar O-acetyltransferase [Enterococcus sp. HY326]
MLPKKIFDTLNSGELYFETKEMNQLQAHYRDLLFEFNQLPPNEPQRLAAIAAELFGDFAEGAYIERPVKANWGINTYFGKNVYANFGLTLVDDAKIDLKDDVMIGPNVTIITGTHPLKAAERKERGQYNLPVTIEKNVWLGAGAIIFPGVTIGENTVIGAGSLVTKSIPANVVAYGQPCKVIKELEK